MPQPTLATVGVIGVLVPWGNTTTQLEIEPFTPPGVINAVRPRHRPLRRTRSHRRQDHLQRTLRHPSRPQPRDAPGGTERARHNEQVIADASGVPTFSSTFGAIHELKQRGIRRVGLIAPAPNERMPATIENFAREGIDVLTAGHGSMAAAARNGVPILAMPMGRDQNHNADVLVSHGIGRQLPPDAEPAAITETAASILDDPEIGAASATIAAQIADHPRIDHAVELVSR